MPEIFRMHPVGALFSDSWRTYKQRFWVLIKIALIPALFLALGSIASSRGFPATIFGFLFSATGGVLAVFASIAIVIALEHKTDFNDSYRKSVPLFWPYIWVSILSALAMLGGFVMLIVPGIILAVALSFSKFIVILENRRGLDALAQSRAYVKGYWWATLGRCLLLALCCAAVILLVVYLPVALFAGKIVGWLLYGIAMLLVTPFALVYTYKIYKNLVALKPEVASGHAVHGKKFPGCERGRWRGGADCVHRRLHHPAPEIPHPPK